MQKQSPGVEILTVGYEGESLDAFLAKLQAAGVECVIDVRQLPTSRKRGFSKTPLAAHLAAAGIGYHHFKELGTPKPWRDEYKRSGDFTALERRFEPYLEEHLPALRAVYDLAKEKRSALLCYETSAHRCHRSTIARRLAELFGGPSGLRIVNLPPAPGLAPEAEAGPAGGHAPRRARPVRRAAGGDSV